MARKSASFLDLHAEKIALGLCALAFVAAAVYSFGGMRFKINDRGPAELVEEAAKQADETARIIANLQPPRANPDNPDKPGENPIKQVQKWLQGPHSLAEIAQVDAKLPRIRKFPWLRIGITYVAPEDRKELVKLVTPSIPLVAGERSPLEMRQKLPLPDLAKVGSSEGGAAKTVTMNYVSVAAQIDLDQQKINFDLAEYPASSRLSFVKVHLQRKDEAEPWRGWQDVDTYLPFLPVERPNLADTENKAGGLSEFIRAVEEGQTFISQPELPSKLRVEYPKVPLLDEWPPKSAESSKADEANRRVRKWTDWGKKALTGKKPFAAVDLDAAFMLAQAAAAETGAGEKEAETAKKLLDEVTAKLPKARKAEWGRASSFSAGRMMPIMAHDLTVEPGRTYVYRIRYEVLNIYAGSPGDLKNADDAKLVTISSNWSPSSRPIEVAGDLMFFLAQADPKKQDVTVAVYKKTRTGWKNQEYKIKVGETIGQKEKLGPNKGIDFATGLLCVDIDFDRLDPSPGGKKTVAMIYTDPADGRLRQRYLSRDRKDKDKMGKQLVSAATTAK